MHSTAATLTASSPLSLQTDDMRTGEKGCVTTGPIKPDFARALFIEAAPSWQEETEPVAIRGPRLVLCRLMFRDHSEVDRPIAVEALVLTEVTDDELTSRLVIFDPDDIDGAFAGTRCAIPRRRSGRACAHMGDHRGCLRRVQSTRVIFRRHRTGRPSTIGER